MLTQRRPRLVILGSGFASFSLLREIDTQRLEVVAISPRNHFLFTPLLPSTTVGTIEFRSIIEPVRMARKGVRFHQARCERINVEKSQIYCEGFFKRTPFEMDYDYLVIGVGAKSNTFGVPGVDEHALFLKELKHARAIRQKIIECFERASKPFRPVEDLRWLLHFVIVGGGPTGVEFAAELNDFIQQDLQRWYPDLVDYVQITLIEAQEQILTSFDTTLRDYARKRFERQGIRVRLGAMVTRVDEEQLILASGEIIRCSLVVWSTGNGPTRFARKCDLPKDRASRFIVDTCQRVKGTDNVFAIGDCCCIENDGLPPTAQVAQQQGKYLAKQLNGLVRGKAMAPFNYNHMGMMAYVGKRRALADLKQYKGRGFTTWIFWRSAYLTKLVSFKNKLLVLSDWLRTAVFGRDISRF